MLIVQNGDPDQVIKNYIEGWQYTFGINNGEGRHFNCKMYRKEENYYIPTKSATSFKLQFIY